MDPHPDSAAAPGGYLFELSGGDLALDFANTVSGRLAAEPVDHLSSYDRLASWGEQAGVLTPEQAARQRAEAERHPRVAASVLRRAIEVREAIFALFSAIATRRSVPGASLDVLNRALPGALARLRLEPEGRGFSWQWRREGEDLEAVLTPVVRAGADLLTSDLLERVRECRADTCAWLFLDRSKNATRCWCDMNVCGNRAKARRHYARERAKESRRARPRTPS
jgi:predicted RNA-binding Zn ribbon-like protein